MIDLAVALVIGLPMRFMTLESVVASRLTLAPLAAVGVLGFMNQRHPPDPGGGAVRG